MDDARPSMDRASPQYTRVAITLHWLIAALLLFEVGLGLRLEDLHGPAKFAAFQLHKSVGITILLLAALRLLWRFYRTPPAVGGAGWERPLARTVHLLFYALLFALPLTGWMTISASRIAVPTLLYGAIPWPDFPGFSGMAAATKSAWHETTEFIHVNLVTILYGLFGLHVAGALKHHLIDRDMEMARMAPGAKPGALTDPRLVAIGICAIIAASLGFRLLPMSGPAPANPIALVVPATPAASPTPPDRAALAGTAEPKLPPAVQETSALSTGVPGRPSGPPMANGPTSAGTASWAIGAGSSLTFHTTWSGAAIDGGFAKFSGDIRFSPDQLARSKVSIKIDTASLFSGDTQRDETLKSADWFAVGSHATASFTADRFEKTGRESYTARGTLALKGVTLPVTLPFRLTINGSKAVMRGTATVDRTAYKIGEGDYASTSEIPAEVSVTIVVKAIRS